jgi:hypothetical protein
MRKINYSEDDLKGFTIKELKRICRYYDIEVFPEWDEVDLKKAILGYAPIELVHRTYPVYVPPHVPYADLPPGFFNVDKKKSVRVERIEQNKLKG